MITTVVIITKDQEYELLSDRGFVEVADELEDTLDRAADYDFIRFAGVDSDRVHLIKRSSIRDITVRES